MPKVISEFGPHLMLDCRQCNVDLISDLNYVYQVLDTLPEAVGMTKIIPPYVFPYSGLVPEDKGITGVVIIAESHITFHSFVEKDYFFFDIFSCKPFDVEHVVQHILNAFEVKDYERHQASRGRYFPREVSEMESPLSSSSAVSDPSALVKVASVSTLPSVAAGVL
ncbi:MAG: S-adenosylmethionine decarboxylase [Candidatus Melainabacteria bacterium]|nr:S-adenosylmethionine decarboxylase [Candidatus Melainabacteria bacterium]